MFSYFSEWQSNGDAELGGDVPKRARRKKKAEVCVSSRDPSGDLRIAPLSQDSSEVS